MTPLELMKRWAVYVSIAEGHDECWTWTAARNHWGYGNMGVGGRRTALAHRVAWVLFRGPINNGLHVLHRCDNPPCVNPDHLFLGSDKDNHRDAMSKGRTMHGVQLPQARLTPDVVRFIRASPLSGRRIAAQVGVSLTAIQNARTMQTWSRVT